MPAGLLGGHVAGRAHDLAGLGLAAVRLEPLGQAEVGDLGRAVGVEQDVGRLQVAMDDPRVMSDLNGPSQRDHQLGRSPARLRIARQPIIQRASFQQFQRHEWQRVDLADLVDLHDVGMLSRATASASIRKRAK